MKNLNIPKTLIWGGILVLIITFWFSVGSLFAQSTWTNCGNGYQTRVVSGVRQYRVVMTTGYSPLMLTDSLAKKLNLADSVLKYVTPTMLNEAIAGATIPDATTTVKGKLKLAGDLSGTADLPTVPGLDLKINLTEKAAVNGVATLGADGKVPNSQIPAIALTNTYPVNSEVEMLALPAEMGDIAVRDDIDKSFVLKDPPASTLSNWIELLSPSVVNTDQVPEGSANLYYTEARVNANTNVAANTANRHAPVTIGTANGLSLSGQQLSLGLASGSAAGALSAADWTNFNSKQAAGSYALTNGTNATGTWPIGITGNAATATNSTQWNGENYISSVLTSPNYFMTNDGTNWHFSTKANMQSALDITSGGETLQSVTDRGNITGNVIQITGANSPSTLTKGLTLAYSTISDYGVINSYDYTNSLPKSLTINPDGGNVGIGTITPTAKLDVNGTGNFSGSGSDSQDVTISPLKFDASGRSINKIALYDGGAAAYGIGLSTENGFDFFAADNGFAFHTGTTNTAGAGSSTVLKILQNGNATFSGSVTAPTFNGNLNGSATLTGTPTAPTAAPGTSTTQIATTAFVQGNSMLLTGNQSADGIKTFTGTVNLPAAMTMNGYVATRQYDTRLLGFTPSDQVARPFLIGGNAPADGQVLTHNATSGSAEWANVGKMFTYTGSGNSIINSISIAHGLSYTPTMVLISPMTPNAAQGSGGAAVYASISGSNVVIQTPSDFTTGTNNLKWTILVK